MDVFKRSLGISRRERVRNKEEIRRIGIDGYLTTDIERKQLIWYGHVQRIEDTRLPKKIMQWVPPNRKKRGRPKKTWKEGVTKAMSTRDLRDGQWDDRRTWKLGIGQRRRTF
ncbi:unnamed protein product [Diabrotica balteata]|uniref:Endonuclease-reverse transcriptase n=1 Tax=Diabrotica balteata TaxID=107213 RepID=A0A9N9XCF2_DIABA|nr:unnamed protein product [Diabrotica balteata]